MFTNLCYIYTYIYCPTARSKGNRIKKITSGSKILREKYFCWKSFSKCGEETCPRLLYKKLTLIKSLDQQSKML